MHTPRALRTLAPALVLVGGLAVAGPALAADRCVNRSGCSAGNTYTAAQLQQALTDAAGAGSGRVLIGAGTYTAPVGGFVLPSGGPVQVIGAGVGATVIQNNAAQANYTFALRLAGGTSSLRDVTVKTAHASIRGLLLQGTTQARSIAVEGTAAASSSWGAFLEGTGSGPLLEDATITMAGGGATAVAMNSASTLRTSRLTSARGISFSMGNGQLADVSRTRINAQSVGIDGDGGNLAARDTLITIGDTAGVGAQAENFNNSTTPASVTLERVTIVGTGGANQVGVSSRTNSATGDDATVTVRSSIITGVGIPLRRTSTAGTATLTTAFTNHAAAGVVDQNTGAGGGAITESNRTDHPVAFVNAAVGDYRPVPGSLLIDAGDPADTGTLDLVGATRPIDGNGDGVARVDLGAFESPFTASVAPTPPPAASTADTTAPTLTKLRITVLGRTAKLRARVSEAGTLRVRITKLTARGKTVRGTRIRVVTVSTAGRVTTSFRLPTLGRYRIKVVARDLAGNSSPTRTRTILRKPLAARAR